MASGSALLAASAACTAAGVLGLVTAQVSAASPLTQFQAVQAVRGGSHAAISHRAAVPPVTVAAPPVPSQVTVEPGDTLSLIAAGVCGNASDWTGLFAANHPPLTDPDAIVPGQVLKVHCYDPGYTYPKPKAVPHVQPTVQATVQAPTAVGAASPGSNPEPAPVAARGVLSAAQVGSLWLQAGGPAWAEGRAEEIAYCESGYRTNAYNPSGATGLWQILGSVVPGSLYDPLVNAENAVAKFKASGDTFAAWVCQ